jgi:hypothetical protein
MRGYLYAAVTATFAVQPSRGADFPKEHLGSGQPILASISLIRTVVTPSKDLRQEYIFCISASPDDTLAQANMLPTQPAWGRCEVCEANIVCGHPTRDTLPPRRAGSDLSECYLCLETALGGLDVNARTRTSIHPATQRTETRGLPSTDHASERARGHLAIRRDADYWRMGERSQKSFQNAPCHAAQEIVGRALPPREQMRRLINSSSFPVLIDCSDSWYRARDKTFTNGGGEMSEEGMC